MNLSLFAQFFSKQFSTQTFWKFRLFLEFIHIFCYFSDQNRFCLINPCFRYLLCKKNQFCCQHMCFLIDWHKFHLKKYWCFCQSFKKLNIYQSSQWPHGSLSNLLRWILLSTTLLEANFGCFTIEKLCCSTLKEYLIPYSLRTFSANSTTL